MNTLFLLILILGPVLLGVAALVAPSGRTRSIIVTAAAALTALVSILTALQGRFDITLGASAGDIASAIELLLGVVILILGLRVKSVLIMLFALAQLAMGISEHWLAVPAAHHAADFILDPLSTILLLVVSIVGSIIVFYAIGYMSQHEHHAPPTAASNGRFFLFLVGFLGAMNGLVLANDLRWLMVFWECTTLCSFFLIGHDGTPESKANSRRALLLNSFGGVALAFASLWAAQMGQHSLSGIMEASPKLLLPMALLCLAAMTKSAQMPFQSWLLGAMVAPTPVSALLHSATMVKAGSYLILRLSPAFANTSLMYIVAIAGAFTFALASALAIAQSNGKKVLAYSTIANLGLIVACAGIGTPLAYSAALMILCFHAASKGLLFLCIGTIEQKIGSRDIEDMGGIMFTLPLTTVITLIGMVSMLAPPFGMLLSKWMTMEAAISSPLVLILVVIGSALTVLFWAKWIGRIQTVSYHEKFKMESLPRSMMGTLLALVAIVVLAGFFSLPIYQYVISPIAAGYFQNVAMSPASIELLHAAGQFTMWPVIIIIGLTLIAFTVTYTKFKPSSIRPPFLCGENIEGITRTYTFRSLMDKSETAWSTSYYLRDLITEKRITFWANLLALMIIIIMFGETRAF